MDRSVEQLVDEILVMDCQSGSIKALETLVSRWQKRLWRYAYNLSDDSEAAWDITQESWLGIIKGLRKLHDPANFRAWAYRITTNKSIDWIEKRKLVKQISIDEVEEQQSSRKGDSGLKELLEQLDVRKKVILSLYYFEKLTVSEMATALKIPKGTVKSRLHNARKEFKEIYQKQFE